MPGFDNDEIVAIQEDTGYLVTKSNNQVITKEESLVIWKHLYKNRDLVGKVTIKNPITDYMNKILYINKNNSFGEKEICKYMISDIKEELDDSGNLKYRVYIQDIQDPLQDVEKSKSLLTIEQLELFVRENSKVKE